MLNAAAVAPISSLDEQSDVAAVFKLHFADVRDTVFAKHDWAIASAVRALAIDADAPERPGYAHAFKKPANALGDPLSVYENGGDTPTDAYENAGDWIYSDADRLVVKYPAMASIENWPVLLRRLVWVALAAQVCKALTDNSSLSEDLYREAWGAPQLDGNGGLFLKAKQENARKNRMRSFFDNGDPLTTARG